MILSLPLMGQVVDGKKAIEKKTDVYEFPVRPGMDEWKKFKTNVEMLEACQIPDEILQVMSTEGLVKTCLDYPKKHDYLCFNSFQYGIRKVVSDFNGLQSLMKRTDAGSVLLDRYSKFDPDSMNSGVSVKERGVFKLDLMFVELLLAQKEILQEMGKEDKQILIGEALIKLVKKQKYKSYGFMNFRTIGMLIGNVLLSENFESFKKKYDNNEEIKLFIEDKVGTDQKIIYEILSEAKKYLAVNKGGVE